MMTDAEIAAFREALVAAGYDTSEKIIDLVRQVKREQADELEWLHAASNNPAFEFLQDEAEDIYSLTDGEPFDDQALC